MKIEYKVIKTVNPYFDRKKEYDYIKVKDTMFLSPKGDFEKYVVDRTDEHLQKVNKWIDRCLLPYMTRKTINYNISGSYSIKHNCERDIKEYVCNSEIMYLLAIRGIKGEYTGEKFPTRLYYPLSSKYRNYRTERPFD